MAKESSLTDDYHVTLQSYPRQNTVCMCIRLTTLKEEGGDDHAMRALFEEEQDEEETDVESDGEDLDEIFELF